MISIRSFKGGDDQLVGGVVAMGEGEEPEARGVVTSQPSKASICPVWRINLVAELQMMLPFGRRTPNDIGPPLFSIQSCSVPNRARLWIYLSH